MMASDVSLASSGSVGDSDDTLQLGGGTEEDLMALAGPDSGPETEPAPGSEQEEQPEEQQEEEGFFRS